jgi:hypothetical protein
MALTHTTTKMLVCFKDVNLEKEELMERLIAMLHVPVTAISVIKKDKVI